MFIALARFALIYVVAGLMVAAGIAIFAYFPMIVALANGVINVLILIVIVAAFLYAPMLMVLDWIKRLKDRQR